MKKFLLAVFSLVLVFGFVLNCYADRRSYVWTYEYLTMPKGMFEVEYYFTTAVPDMNKSNVNTLKQLLELEYGITNHWDISIYQRWKHENTSSGSSSQYDGFKIRTRYRFGEEGEFFLDPLIYLEYIRDDDFSKPNIGEVKFILAKTINNFNLSYNQIFKRDLERDGKTDHEYAVGISYNLLPNFKLGVESKGNYSKDKYAFGPTLSFSISKFWVAFGAVLGLNDRTDDLQTRMIVGVPF